jgi:hypothetical protein
MRGWSPDGLYLIEPWTRSMFLCARLFVTVPSQTRTTYLVDADRRVPPPPPSFGLEAAAAAAAVVVVTQGVRHLLLSPGPHAITNITSHPSACRLRARAAFFLSLLIVYGHTPAGNRCRCRRRPYFQPDTAPARRRFVYGTPRHDRLPLIISTPGCRPVDCQPCYKIGRDVARCWGLYMPHPPCV